MIRCPNCKRFTSNNQVWVDFDGNIKRTEGTCKRCGPISPEYGAWEDWFGWDDEAPERVQADILAQLEAEGKQ